MRNKYTDLKTRGSANSGFTLIELIIVMALVSLVVSVAVPASVGMYGRYRASLGAEKVLLFMSEMQREAFTSGQGIKVDAVEGTLTVKGNAYPIDGTFSSIDGSIVFFENGTTSGGTVTVYVEGYAYYVVITPPFGGMVLTETNT
ncbi:MAG: prepilin-type N-terminal cleavage/methylation domain-containing protein [Nitrospirae bacterium]|nr:prepilin-type N-terminal cleavage/methylation domain-containing protein [Nitrospirota bacterium]